MSDLQQLTRQLDELASKEAIRECIYRVVRGLDRADTALLRSGFHPDAKVLWHGEQPLELEDWLQQGAKMIEITQRVQHLVGNTLIELDGDTAKAESYEIGRHLTKMGEEWKDLIIAARYLDKLSRRNGVWKIDYRVKLMDWARIMEGSDPVFDGATLKGSRDAQDPSYKVLGTGVFKR